MRSAKVLMEVVDLQSNLLTVFLAMITVLMKVMIPIHQEEIRTPCTYLVIVHFTKM